jgi:hypothetical protein
VVLTVIDDFLHGFFELRRSVRVNRAVKPDDGEIVLRVGRYRKWIWHKKLFLLRKS